MILYLIYTNAADFVAKNDSIMETGRYATSAEYANLDASKHPTEDKWAMRVREDATDLFDLNACVELTSDWLTSPRTT
jgi:hypothetical protein